MFAERLKIIRKEKGYTQVSLAEKLEVSKGTVAMWETGKRTPDFETLINLSDLFDVRTDYLLGKSDDSSSPKLTDEEINQLGRWELENTFADVFKMYLSLDCYGQSAVENLIKSEQIRCRDQGSTVDISNIKFSIRVE